MRHGINAPSFLLDINNAPTAGRSLNAIQADLVRALQSGNPLVLTLAPPTAQQAKSQMRQIGCTLTERCAPPLPKQSAGAFAADAHERTLPPRTDVHEQLLPSQADSRGLLQRTDERE